MVGAVSRAFWRWQHKYWQPRRAGIAPYYQAIVGSMIFFYAINYGKISKFALLCLKLQQQPVKFDDFFLLLSNLQSTTETTSITKRWLKPFLIVLKKCHQQHHDKFSICNKHTLFWEVKTNFGWKDMNVEGKIEKKKMNKNFSSLNWLYSVSHCIMCELFSWASQEWPKLLIIKNWQVIKSRERTLRVLIMFNITSRNKCTVDFPFFDLN